MKKHFTETNIYYNLFVLLSLSGSLLFFLYAFFAGAAAFDWAAMESNGNLQFCDYFMHIAFVADRTNLYSRATGPAGCFPPLAYIMYYFLFKITMSTGIVPADSFEAEHAPYATPVFMYYTIFVSMLLFFAIFMWNNRLKKSVVIFTCLMLSIPFFEGGIERGNSTVLVMAMLMMALKLKDSDDQSHRKIAIILIAVCAGFKIYPAVLGLLYLKEKRFEEAIKLTICGITFFFVPFIFFGGFNGFRLWLNNILSTMGMASDRRIQYVKGAIQYAYQCIFKAPAPSIIAIAPFLFLAAMIVLSWMSRSKYRELFFLCSVMVFFPTNAYRYTLCYLCIPLIAFLSNEEQTEKSSFHSAEIILYGLLFTIPTVWGALTSFGLTFPYGRDIVTYDTLTYVEVWLYLIAYTLLGVMTAHEICDLAIQKTR